MSPDDVLIWPCGTYCQRYQLAEHGHLSDDYELLKAGSYEWRIFMNDPELWLSR
jgi:hypothetical protein